MHGFRINKAGSWQRDKLPAMFMPKAACRLRLEVVSVRREQLSIGNHPSGALKPKGSIASTVVSGTYVDTTMYERQRRGTSSVEVIEFKVARDG